MTKPVDQYGPSCDLIPGVMRGGKQGWYLVAANFRVEAGPFASVEDAQVAAFWMDEECRGVHPAPWRPVWARNGLLIGTRLKPERVGLDRVAGYP